MLQAYSAEVQVLQAALKPAQLYLRQARLQAADEPQASRQAVSLAVQ
jgi:hypothetical protein